MIEACKDDVVMQKKMIKLYRSSLPGKDVRDINSKYEGGMEDRNGDNAVILSRSLEKKSKIDRLDFWDRNIVVKTLN
uniref:Uncharacterized protein n=1 Tax=Pristionchus pacificus TaxID=54126 RepID=A0A2A6BZP8_PRIPA|eukprot:PDM71297.1 hypothetical protein PRIPAC_37704 [Pristionchus pacificus]